MSAAGNRRLPISVVVPAHNRAGMIERALGSVAAQVPPLPAEIVVVDDGSTDATADLAARAGATVVRHDQNRGAAAARNSGIEAATQPWIAFLDSDDHWLPHHLATLWGVKGTHDLVAASALHCGETPQNDRLHGPESPRPLTLLNPTQLIYPGNVIPTSAAMARRSAIEAVDGFRPPATDRDLDRCQDLDLWLRMLELGSGVVLPEVTAVCHLHAQQNTRSIPVKREMHLEVARRFEDRWWWSEDTLERWRAAAAWNKLRTAIKLVRPLEAMGHLAWILARPIRIHGAMRARIAVIRKNRRARLLRRGGVPSVLHVDELDGNQPAQGAPSPGVLSGDATSR